MAAEAGNQSGVDLGERLGGVFLKFGLEAGDAELFAFGVGGFDEAIGVQCEQTAGIGITATLANSPSGKMPSGMFDDSILRDFVGVREKYKIAGWPETPRRNPSRVFARKQNVTNMSGFFSG